MAALLFDSIAEALEQATSLDRLESRGTLRLALKTGGLDARSLTAEQLAVVLRKLMPAELETRGVENSQSICETLAQTTADLAGADASRAETPESVFQRLGG